MAALGEGVRGRQTFRRIFEGRTAAQGLVSVWDSTDFVIHYGRVAERCAAC